MLKYRVIVKVSYYETWFEFDNAEEACEFAKLVMLHQVPNEDTKKPTYVTMKVVDTELEAQRKKEEEEDE